MIYYVDYILYSYIVYFINSQIFHSLVASYFRVSIVFVSWSTIHMKPVDHVLEKTTVKN